jgi:hypothetical protein
VRWRRQLAAVRRRVSVRAGEGKQKSDRANAAVEQGVQAKTIAQLRERLDAIAKLKKLGYTSGS